MFIVVNSYNILDKYGLYMYNSPMNEFPAEKLPELGRLLKDFSHTGRLVQNRLDLALANHGLSIAKLSVLEVLSKAEGPLPLSQVAERLSCVRSNVTQLIDRMEAEGLVQRLRDPEDRRSVRAVITDEGKRRFRAGIDAADAVENELFGGLSPQEQELLHQLLGRFSDLTKQEG